MNASYSPLGCSAFCLHNNSDIWIARNLDVPFTNGHILTNPRNISKQSIVGNDLSPARWTSRFGSLTVNLLGVDFPMGGINECGLVIEHLWMPGTEYPDPLECDILLEFEWIQFMLDTCSCVNDVRAQAEKVAILPGRVEMHFLLADGAGNCALFEFRGGQQLIYTGTSFQPPVVTNSWYDESVRYISSLVGFGGDSIPSPSSTESLDRFARLAFALHNEGTIDSVSIPETAMRLLDSVVDNTLLSAVFHPSVGDLYFKTCRNADQRMVRIADCDFSPASPRMMLDIHASTNAMKHFDSQEIVSSMQEVLSVGKDFLYLDAYERQMMSRQMETSSI